MDDDAVPLLVSERCGPDDPLRCRCFWNGARCPNFATQEDALCDWCGSNRAVTVAGAGQLHEQTGGPGTAACWYPGSGAVVLDG